MLETYGKWIDQIQGPVAGRCKELSEAMHRAFPELRVVRGHYICPVSGHRPHWWLMAADGEIVDPTARQFVSGGIGEYQPLDESQPQPTGRCANCGQHCYNAQVCCSDDCCREYADYCMGANRA